MQVFKCALRVIRGNLVFLLVYIIGLSFMGVFMAQGFDYQTMEQTLEAESVEFAVVDRDDSPLSRAVIEVLDERGERVTVEDSALAFQDAAAKGETDYLLVIPEGYQREFCEAVERGGDIPQLDAVFSYYFMNGAKTDEVVNLYLSMVRTLMLADAEGTAGGAGAVAGADATGGNAAGANAGANAEAAGADAASANAGADAEAAGTNAGADAEAAGANAGANAGTDAEAALMRALPQARELVGQRTDVEVIASDESLSQADQFAFYLQWSTYTLFTGIVVCVGLLISTMNRADVRRRNLSSPMSYTSYNWQLALSCGVLALASSAWTFLLGIIAFPEAAVTLTVGGILLSALSVLAYACMALAFGFMLGQFGASSIICNAVGNITGMVISFLGGAWMSTDLMSPGMVALAHWFPGYWYTNACQQALHLGDAGQAGLFDALGSPAATGVFTDVGILLVFALAFLCIGFVTAKRRLQTAEAGGNRAAETVVV